MLQAAEPGTLQVGSYVRQWLDLMRGRVRAKTHEGYEGLIPAVRPASPGGHPPHGASSPAPPGPVLLLVGRSRPSSAGRDRAQPAPGPDPGPGPGGAVGTTRVQPGGRGPASPASATVANGGRLRVGVPAGRSREGESDGASLRPQRGEKRTGRLFLKAFTGPRATAP
jgi:hypothetical protein